MRKFVFRLIVFMLPILLVLGLVELRLRTVPTGDRLRKTYLERNIDSCQVIITGSSHAYYGVNPKMLGDHVFSIAYTSQDLYYDTRILLKYLPRARSLKLVIIPISYFSFNGTLEDSGETWRTAYYARFWGIPRPSGWPRIEDYSLIALYGIPQTRSFLWHGIPTDTLQHFDEHGGNSEIRNPDPALVLNAQAAIDRHGASFSLRNVARNQQYLEELLVALDQRGIRVVFITTPCFRSYYDNLKPEIYGVMQSEIKSLGQKYGLEYYSYLSDPRFTIEDFWDSNHLSAAGAEKLSRILREEVVNKQMK